MPKPEKTVEKSHAVMYNFESNSFSLVDYPQGFSSVGLSLHAVCADSLLILGGTKKIVLFYTKKSLQPDPCAQGTLCSINDTFVNPIEWVECEYCVEWLHLICEKIQSVPKGKYKCTKCKRIKTKKPKY